MLGYPELATGDAYKALVLCDAAENVDESTLWEQVRSHRGMRFDRFRKKKRAQVSTNAAGKSMQACERQQCALHFSLYHVLQASSLSLHANHRCTPDRSQKHGDPIVLTVAAIRQEVCFVLVTALELCTSYHEAFAQCKDAATLYPLDERFVKLFRKLCDYCLEEDAHKGGFLATLYPWMSAEHKKRSVSILATAIAHIQGISSGICTLSESTIAPSSQKPSKHVKWLDNDPTKPFTITGKAIPKRFIPARQLDGRLMNTNKIVVPHSDILGVFATRDIPRGTLLLTDLTVTGAASVTTSNTCSNCYSALGHTRLNLPCCSMRFCKPLCRDLALASYHDAICSSDVDWVEQDAAYHRSDHPRTLLLLRFLATAVHEDTHPLSHELAACLTGHYSGKHVSTFTLQESIAQPVRMLRDLGVDVFADERFDTWILLTLQHRISINKRAEPFRHGGYMVSVNPCFSMFNHSCENNASWEDGGTSTVQVRADRDIKKGEEVFLNYGGSGEWLTHWFGGMGCACPKCVREAADKATAPNS